MALTPNPNTSSFYVGSIYVNYDGTGASSLDLTAPNPALEGYSLYSSTGQYIGPEVGPGQTFSLGSIAFGGAATPEPASLGLLSIGGLLIARRRRV
jgi:hypothetical protein